MKKIYRMSRLQLPLVLILLYGGFSIISCASITRTNYENAGIVVRNLDTDGDGGIEIVFSEVFMGVPKSSKFYLAAGETGYYQLDVFADLKIKARYWTSEYTNRYSSDIEFRAERDNNAPVGFTVKRQGIEGYPGYYDVIIEKVNYR
jgi:hypothetical protein